MRTPKYRVYIKYWGSSENDGMEYPKEGELHVYIGNWERGRYKEAIFQQFTGLKDSKGVEIYEGDIVKGLFLDTDIRHWGEATTPVVWVDRIGGFNLSSDTWDRTSIEVVGNIFNNKLGAKLRLDKRLAGREKPNLNEVEFGTPHLKED